MTKWIIATLAGIAFVAGGFVAGTLGGTTTAEAVTDDTVVADDAISDDGTTPELTDAASSDDAPEFGRRGGRHDRGFGFGGLGDVVDELDIDTDAFREAIADGATVAEALDAQGISESEAADALLAAAQEKLDEAVAEGRIDEDRAAEISDGLAERVDEFLASTPANRAFAHRHPVAAVGISQVAEILGVDADVVADGLRDGQSIAEIAEENGVSRADLVDQLVTNATERIETWVDAVPGSDDD